MFGIARQPGRTFFNASRHDVLYFAPRDGYMASEAQLRTVLALADPADLTAVRRLALNNGLFWVGGSGAGLATGDGAAYHNTVAASLTAEVLRQVTERMPFLEEIIFVPRDENPLYCDGVALVEPPCAQGRMARQIEMAVGSLLDKYPGWRAPGWRILSLSCSPSGADVWYQIPRPEEDGGSLGFDRGDLGGRRGEKKRLCHAGDVHGAVERQFRQPLGPPEDHHAMVLG